MQQLEMMRINSINPLPNDSDFLGYSPYNPTPIPSSETIRKEEPVVEPTPKIDQAQIKIQSDMKRWQREMEKVC